MSEQRSNLEGLYRERTSLRTRLLAIFVLLFGILLLVAANGWDWLRHHYILTSLVRDCGSLLIVSVPVAVLWELYAKRAFIDELLSKARASVNDLIARTILARELQEAGLRAFTTDFAHQVNWLDLFRNARRVDLFFSYARSWMNINNAQLEELARREGARIRVVLPDPDNQELVSELARRFGKQTDEIRASILATRDDFFRMFVTPFQDNRQGPDFSLFYASTAPQFTFYRFDSRSVLALYKHRQGRGGVPVFEAEEGGTIHLFIQQEMDAFIGDEQLARRVHPAPRQD
jgi:hypothetical protein